VFLWKPGAGGPQVVGYSVAAGSQIELAITRDKLPLEMRRNTSPQSSLDVATAWTSSESSEQYFFTSLFLRDLER
jgi:hypothetical protein